MRVIVTTQFWTAISPPPPPTQKKIYNQFFVRNLKKQIRGDHYWLFETEICNRIWRTGEWPRIWRTGEWPTPWTQSLIITLPKKGNLQFCQNYRIISLISHSSIVMLKVSLIRLKPLAKEIIAEEQAVFIAGRSTTEQIFNFRILCENYL